MHLHDFEHHPVDLGLSDSACSSKNVFPLLYLVLSSSLVVIIIASVSCFHCHFAVLLLFYIYLLHGNVGGKD